MNQRLMVIAGAIVLIVAGLGAYLMTGGRGDAAPGDTAAEVLAIGAHDRVLGSADAPVTVVEYFAPSCPVCARFDEVLFPKIKEAYIDTGKVRYVMRTYLLRQADGAAEAIARCLPDDQYYGFIQTLFRGQADWDPEFGIEDVHGALQKMGRFAGLTAEKVDACIDDKGQMAKINKVSEDASKRLGINSTPTLFVNGVQQASGLLPWETVKAAIDEALAAEEAKKAK